MGGLAELIEGEDGAYVEPFSCLAPTSVTASSVETMLMRMLASVPTQSQLGGFANREKLFSRLLFDRWWEAKIQQEQCSFVVARLLQFFQRHTDSDN